VKPNINLIAAHPQLKNNGHLVDGVLVDVVSLWPCKWLSERSEVVRLGILYGMFLYSSSGSYYSIIYMIVNKIVGSSNLGYTIRPPLH
jgi:hypothetical protein